MKPLRLLGVLLAASAFLGACTARACHSDEATAGLCGSARDIGASREVVSDCLPGEEIVCAGRLQRLRDAAIVVGRYTALGRASLDGSASRR